MRESYRLVKAVLRMEVSLNHIETVLELIREQQQGHALSPAEKEDRWCNIADVKQMFQISDSTIYRLKKLKILQPDMQLGRMDFYRESSLRKLDVLIKRKKGKSRKRNTEHKPKTD